MKVMLNMAPCSHGVGPALRRETRKLKHRPVQTLNVRTERYYACSLSSATWYFVLEACALFRFPFAYCQENARSQSSKFGSAVVCTSSRCRHGATSLCPCLCCGIVAILTLSRGIGIFAFAFDKLFFLATLLAEVLCCFAFSFIRKSFANLSFRRFSASATKTLICPTSGTCQSVLEVLIPTSIGARYFARSFEKNKHSLVLSGPCVMLSSEVLV